MGESSTGEELSHQNMGNIIRYFQYEAEVGDGGLVVEELKESRYSNSIPRQFLDLIAVERADDVEIASTDLQSFLALKKPTKDGGFYNQILQTIQDEGDATVVREWLEDRLQRRKDYLSQLRKNIQFLLQRDNQKRYFKASVEKKSEDLKFVPINLHVEDYLVGPTNAFVNEEKRKSSKKVAIYEFTTVGAMAAHCYKFKNGGITSMINKLFKLQQKKNEHDANSEATRWNEEGRAIDDLKWDVKLRMDVCFSQALTALVACFVRKIELAFQSPDSTKGELILNQLSRIGFLFQVESLLSTHGNEIGMLEDMSAAVERLSTVAFCIQDVRDKPFGRFSFRRRLTIKDMHNSSSDSVHEDVVVKVQIAEKPKSQSNSHIKYVVTVHVNCTETLLPSRLMDGGEISVTPLLFTQGINEMQSIANGTERGKTELQDVINMRNILPLQDYCNQYNKFSQSWAIQRMKRKSSESDRTQMLTDEEVKRQLQTIQIAIEEAANSIVKTKRPDILTKSSDLCRSLGGGRVTICKSAKDRTAMSVTLEQVRILHRFHGLPEYKVASTVAVMRTHGVRIENALKNTGKRQFAFNKLQRYAMPEDYRCPESTGGTGNIS
ncbi:inositol-3,4-bisphosphate 4-phosphatase [Thraustotheca clavata]|uniref:Inositol-3,4-bisphosphate 4-phosphatase n=1 Tax=Thraustotheca clavata TaxID=74557 RepID=A0A1W0A8C0_9STRA|nr:inositol-3,4-bisphosphate 4-phosphatase [Thraustotheca clavata]